MRITSSLVARKSMLRIAGAVLLASTATGCSSDATRFSGLFSDTDSITTASIPQRQGSGAYGQAPVPRGDLGGGMSAAPAADYGSRSAAMGQPYPGADGGYGSVASPARSAAAPAAVQRVELAPPGGAAPAAGGDDFQNRQQAMAQPFPPRQEPAPARSPAADDITTGTVKTAAGWSTINAPRVTLKAGESAATLSRRYGVPEKEILKANGGKLVAGQSVIIPAFGPAGSSGKAAAGEIALQDKAPAPVQQQEQKVAVLPGVARDKGLAEPAKVTPPAGGGGTYTVKPGDTLTKIARANGVTVDQLKAANGLTTENIRIGQVLNISSSAAPAAADPVQTASVPPKIATPAVTQPVAATPAPVAQASAPAKPAETASVSEVSLKSDTGATAPQSTGIGKYRWPVNGAVIAGFGQNVEGNRNDGINISVPEGTPIKAAENGVVIYAGNGLKQLGNTVLVRHDDGKVTVYGHAGSLGVSRGQKVTRGQTIASSGMSGDAKRPQVHFEVRKDATPVNPITFLE